MDANLTEFQRVDRFQGEDIFVYIDKSEDISPSDDTSLAT